MANILLMESQPYMGEFISEMLGQQGHEIIRVKDPDSLAVELEEICPDLVIIDLNGLDGWNLLNEVKRHEKRIPVLVVTAFDSFTKDPWAGKVECLVIKDVTMNALKERVSEILESSP